MSVQFNHGDLSIVFRGSQAAQSVGKSLGKLSTGEKNLISFDDSGSFQQVIKYKNEQKRAEQTLANLQNLISYTQSQDKALEQAGKILQRLNFLSASALDVTKTDEDRTAYNHEVEELANELERIKQTTFNELNLFSNGPFSDQKKEFIKILQSQWLSGAEQAVQDRLGIQGSGRNILRIEVPENQVFPTIWSYSAEEKTLANGSTVEETTVKFYLDTYQSANFPIATPSDWAERYNVLLMSKMVMADNLYFNALADGNNSRGGSNTGGAEWFKEGVAQFAHGGDYLLEYLVNSGVSLDQNFIDSIGTGDTSSGSDQESGSGYLAVRYLHQNLTDAGHAGGVKDMLVWMAAQVSAGKTQLESSIGAALTHFLPAYTDATTANDQFIADYKANALSYPGLNVTLFNLDTGAIGGADADNGAVIDHAGAVPSYASTPPTQDPLVGFQESWEEEGKALYSFSVSGDSVVFETVNLPTVESTTTYNLKTLDSAKSSLGYFESLIESLADQRARVGANLQRLFYESDRLERISTNRASALEKINGLDLAMEGATLAKNQLLLKANQSILKGSQGDQVIVGDLLSGVKAAPNKI